jgi:thiosulfate/3-mercaptopyruvate sulfurtransferase
MAVERDPLVSTEWLAERLSDPNIRPVDASWWFPHENRDGTAEFEAAHIPGAVFFDIDAIADHTMSLPHMLPTPEAFAQAVGALGLGDGSSIVIYEAGAPRSAARAWWSFRAMGHGDVRVLDGGLPKWRREGRPIETGAAHPTAATFTPRFDPGLVRASSDIRSVLADGSAQIADARPGPRFRGEAPEPREGLKSGHMPGARNLPANEFYAPDGTMLGIAELSAKVASVRIDPDMPLISSCGSGITACIIALAMARLGRWDTAVYDGSWAEWGALPDAPIVTDAR